MISLPNDNEETEPTVLPSRFLNLLVNGSVGNACIPREQGMIKKMRL